jgi:hypothetical protein
MPTSREYRKSAAECRELASQTLDQQEREGLLIIAAQWDKLAEYKDREESKES